ncbi:NfeD family protein [Qipengyuania xiapuensis]|uniref:NfeD family protein n=1 Tax=Qipengyuania xiapuensis TaxID=2867236 RepID=A0ABX8ZXW5_9SPHN|nr:NfeD family protein [Qipengyuania xiapuensis]QZD93687.1 NfeD family protein [Qipengyuania xiapuensis]
MDWFETLEPHWVWLGLGFFLAAAEILVPGYFLMWLAGAALITGVIAFALPFGIPLQVVIFAVLSIAAVFIGRNYLRANPVEDADPKMNRRGMRLAGETAVVVTALDGGTGRVKHGDSEWLAKGCDATVGEKVRISGSDGAVLIVEKL